MRTTDSATVSLVLRAIALVLLPLASWAADARPPGWADTGTIEMAKILEERVAAVDPKRLSLVVNDRRAEMAELALRQVRSIDQKLELLLMYGTELMNA